MTVRPFAALCALFALSTAAFADPAVLRDRVEAQSGALTLGDLFVNAGEAAATVIAPAPAPGAQAALSAAFVAETAHTAGLDWTPPPGLREIVIHGRTLRQSPFVAQTPNNAAAPSAAAPASAIAIRRGDAVMITYAAPGLRLSTRARAMQDAAVGQPIRVTNLQSNRVIDAVVTGPGAASANP